MTTSSLRDLIDEQFAVSGAAAKLAAARASGASVRRLHTLVHQLSGAASLGSRIRADSRFHIEVAHGVAVRAAHPARGGAADAARRAAVAAAGGDRDGTAAQGAELLDHVAVAAEHAAIADAIAAEDGDRARLLAERHVEWNLRRLTAMRLAMAQDCRTGSGRGVGDLDAPARAGPGAARGSVRAPSRRSATASRRSGEAASPPAPPSPKTGSPACGTVIWHRLSLLPAADGAGIVAARGVVAGKDTAP